MCHTWASLVKCQKVPIEVRISPGGCVQHASQLTRATAKHERISLQQFAVKSSASLLILMMMMNIMQTYL